MTWHCRWAVGAGLMALTALLSCHAAAADLAFGQYLAGECVTCHRTDGAAKGIPPIVGWPSDTFVAALKAYKAKERANPIMQTIAGRLSDVEMAALAAYYGSLPQ